MITVRAVLTPGGFELIVSGHEDLGSGQGGRVCAAVSAVTQTALLGLEQLGAQYPDLLQVHITESETL